MNNTTRILLGIKDQHIDLDPQFSEPIEDQDNQIVVHLIQAYPMFCPHCGQLMLKNGFKTVNALAPTEHYKPPIWSIRKQKYICKSTSSCPHDYYQIR